jgi:S1-C subfamily serine protease
MGSAAAAEPADDTAQIEAQLADAQARLEQAAEEVAALSAQLAGPEMDRMMIFDAGPPRPLIGVQLDPDSSKDGARVVSVSPGGPAAEAGIKADDVIVAVGDESMVGRTNVARDVTQRLREVPPDQPVTIKVLRAGKPLKFAVTPRPLEGPAFGFRGPMPFAVPLPPGPRMPPGAGIPHGPAMPPVPPTPGTFATETFVHPVPAVGALSIAPFEHIRQGLVGLELVTITPGLGAYFGTDKGVLVVRAPKRDALKLEEGDVILDIGGRAPTSGAHATRILASYQPGEKLAIDVLRQKKKVRIDAVMPG